jgi:hypothetical protein
MLGSNLGLLRLGHWQSDALTTRLDLIHRVIIAIPHVADLLTNMRREEEGELAGEEGEEGEDRVPELPGIPQLQHLAKNRPRRPKRHASTGALGQVPTTAREGWPLLTVETSVPDP